MPRMSPMPIPIPHNTPGGRINTRTNGYVYWTTKTWWDNETKNAKDNRKLIGKVLPDDETMMRPNKWYIENLSYLFEEQHILSHNNVLAGGVFIAALRAAQMTGILSALKKAYPDQWERIFAACVYWIDQQTSTAQYFKDWFFDNYCGLNAAMDGGAFTDLYKDISENGYQRDRYWETFREEYDKRFPKPEGEKVRIVGCDGSNSNMSDKDNELGSYGHAKDDNDTPIVNYMNFVDEMTGITLYWEYYPGPLLDKTEFPYAVERARELGYEYLHLMMDRGFITNDMIKAFAGLKEEHGIEFSAMIPSTFGFVDDIICAFRETVRNNQEHYIHEEHVYGMTIPEDYLKKNYPEYFVDGKPLMHVFLFYDDLRAAKERDAINNKVATRMSMILEKKEYTENLIKEAGKYLIVEKAEKDPVTKREFVVKRNNKVIQEEIDRAGYFLMASNGDDGSAFEISIARKRDRNEKSFRRRKSFFGLATPGTGTDETFDGKMIVADIAQSIQESMEYLARSYIRKKSSETFGTTVGELHKIKIKVNEDGSMKLAFPLTKEQKELVQCFELDALEVDTYVRSLRWGKSFDEIRNKKEQKQLEKEEKKKQRDAEKAKERARKQAEKEAERARKQAEKEEEKARKQAEKAEERARKQAEKKDQKKAQGSNK